MEVPLWVEISNKKTVITRCNPKLPAKLTVFLSASYQPVDRRWM